MRCPHCQATFKDTTFTETVGYDCVLMQNPSGPISRTGTEYEKGLYEDEKYYCESCGKSFKQFKDWSEEKK